jgi:hypothetical protein
LWIIDKGAGSGGFYDGGAIDCTLNIGCTRHDPSTAAGLPGNPIQPAHVFGASGIAPGVGTFLVSSGWINSAGDDFLSVIRVDDPLGTPMFSNTFVDLGDITTDPPLPDAPQSETDIDIDTGDGRIQDAVWRDNSLWIVHTVNPPSGPDTGQATVHWYEIDTTNLAALSLVQQGDVGGEDIASHPPPLQAHTFFPSIMVDRDGNMAVGFAASAAPDPPAASIFPGAYYTGREATDPSGTMQPTLTLAVGQDFYVRTFDSIRNRWGDYSSISIDPSDELTFWVFNAYALTRATPIEGEEEDGRWGTRFGAFTFKAPCEGDLDHDGDVDETDLFLFAEQYGRIDCPIPPCISDFEPDGDVDGTDLFIYATVFAVEFGRTDCPIPPATQCEMGSNETSGVPMAEQK